MDKKIMPIWLWLASVFGLAITIYYLCIEIAAPDFPIDMIGFWLLIVSVFTIFFRMIRYGKGKVPKVGWILLVVVLLGLVLLFGNSWWQMHHNPPYDPGFL